MASTGVTALGLDPAKEVQRVDLGGENYVVLRESTFQRLVDQLEELDTSAEIHRSREGLFQQLIEALQRQHITGAELQRMLQAPTFGARLKILRESRGLAQKELADKAGVSQTLISNLETGAVRDPSASVLYELLSVLKVPPDALYAFFLGK